MMNKNKQNWLKRNKSVWLGAIIGAVIGLCIWLWGLLLVGERLDAEEWLSMIILIFGVGFVGALFGQVVSLINHRTRRWKIGALIGFSIGIFIILLSFHTNALVIINKPALFILSVLGFEKGWFRLGLAIYSAPLIYSLIGAVIGLFVDAASLIIKENKK